MFLVILLYLIHGINKEYLPWGLPGEYCVLYSFSIYLYLYPRKGIGDALQKLNPASPDQLCFIVAL